MGATPKRSLSVSSRCEGTRSNKFGRASQLDCHYFVVHLSADARQTNSRDRRAASPLSLFHPWQRHALEKGPRTFNSPGAAPYLWVRRPAQLPGEGHMENVG